MDASRQLREDNLLLRKELQTYREREMAMMNRLETLEKRLNDLQTKEPERRRHRSSHNRSRRSSLASSRGTPELPPIETRSRSVDSPKEKPKETEKEKIETPRLPEQQEATRQPTPPKDEKPANLDKIAVKQPLLSQSKTKKGVAKLRRTSNSSSNSNSSNNNSDSDVKGIQRRQPITPKLDSDYLQTEIQIQRSDNSILRQDIQVYRSREQQLYSRNQELTEKLVEVLSPRATSRERTPPSGQEKSEVNINVDFVTDGSDGPKAIFDAKKAGGGGKKATDSDNESTGSTKRDSSKDRKAPSRESSKDRGKPMAVPKKKKPATSSSSGNSSAEGEKKKEAAAESESTISATATVEKKVKIETNEANNKNGVPKAKTAQNGKSKQPAAAAAKKNGTANKEATKKSPKGSSSSDDVKKEQLIDDEEWKVTITSKHELETRSDEPNKVVIVKPKEKEEVKVEEKKAVAKKVTKAKKKVEKTKDARKDPIPKPSMFPAARPPRGYVPPCALPNSSYGVTSAIMGGPAILDGSGPLYGMPMTPGHHAYPRSGRASSIDSDPGEISMVIKQEPRDSLVDAVPPRIYAHTLPRTPVRTPARTPAPPICQVSYDSVYDDPYYSMSYY